jgi:aspartyl-tRNA(Asn)/glutamyl-tRNA(Gln) amidotransferase subunit A
MSDTELARKSLTEISALLRAKALSSVELVEVFLKRIQRIDPSLHAYITVCAEEALRTARQADEARISGTPNGLLHGIPIAIKDQMHMQGVRTTAGSFLDFFPNEDSTVVAKLKSAGAIILGKLNLSEFAFGGNIGHPFGTPRNPWDTNHQPGHSSSGSGIAVAAALCTAAIGEDTGGSIRIPAAWCGITGLRPTWGRVSRYGIQPISWSMDQAGPMARSVEDCAQVFQAISGYDLNDPSTSHYPVLPFTPKPDLSGIRIGVIQESLDNDLVHSEVRAAVGKAAKVMGEIGATVSDISLPILVKAGVVSAAITDADGAFVHRHWLRNRSSEYDSVTRRRLLAGSLISNQLHQKAQRFRVLIRRQIILALQNVDILLSPTQPTSAAKLETTSGLDSKDAVLQKFAGPRGATAPFNLSSVPAISIPCGFTSAGLPIGLQLAARPFDELALFQTGHSYQQHTSWHNRHPVL